MQTAANELGIVVEGSSVEMTTDSSSAESFASRRSSGRIRHIEVKRPWLQQAVADGRFRMSKVEGALTRRSTWLNTKDYEPTRNS